MKERLFCGVGHCMKQMAERIRCIKNYILVTKSVLDREGAQILKKLQNQMLTVTLFSYYEASLVCMIYQAMIADKFKVKKLYGTNNDKINEILGDWVKKYQELYGHAMSMVSFSDKKLPKFKKQFEHFFGFELFKNTQIENIIMRFKDYRNLIIHHQALPPKSYLEKIGPSSEIIDSNIRRVYGLDVLHELNITDESLAKTLEALAENFQYYQKELEKLDEN